MACAVCVTCGVQFSPSGSPPPCCPICEDPRQYVPDSGQAWTTVTELRRDHRNRIAAQGELTGIGTEPRFGIGQRALLVPYGDSNLLWDCVTLLDEATAAEIERRGGLAAIAISHPHFYAAMVDWARRFDCPIHLHAADAEWIQRPDAAIALWEGERLELGDGVTLVRCGGHFPGATALHHAQMAGGAGALLCGDVALPVPDRRYVKFMWSYPNGVPLPAGEVARIGRVLAGYRFEVLHAGFWDSERRDASAVVARSVDRYVRALQRPGG